MSTYKKRWALLVSLGSLLIWACPPALGQAACLSGTWYDQDKTCGQSEWWYDDDNGDLKWNQGEDYGCFDNPADIPGGWIFADPWHEGWFDDVDIVNGVHDPGEPAAKYPDAAWTNGTQAADTSCWTASAANLVSYVGGANPYETWAYTTGVNGKTFDDPSGGQMHEALESGGYRANWILKTILTPWPLDPVTYTETTLQGDLPVSIGIAPILKPQHALTVYAIDPTARTITLADSDQDPSSQDFKTYNYTYAFGITGWTWTLDDYYASPAEINYACSFAPCIWQGSGSGGSATDWHAGANWSVNEVPHDRDIVEISFVEPGTVSIAGDAAAYRLRAHGSDTNVELGPGASLFVARSEYLGDSGSATFVQHGGTHTVGRDLYVGRMAGGTGTYDLAAGELTALNIYIGDEGTGALNWSGGSLSAMRVEIGTHGTMTVGVNWDYDGALGISGGTVDLGSHTLTLNTGGTVSLRDGQLAANRQHIGYYGQGQFSQTGGTNRGTNAESRLYIGYGAGSEGMYELNEGELSVPYQYIGRSGTGRLIHTGGRNTRGDFGLGVCVGYGSGSHGTYELSGTGQIVSDWEFIGSFGGAGTFTQSGGENLVGSLHVPYSSGSGIYIISEGSLAVSNLYLGRDGSGTLSITGSDAHVTILNKLHFGAESTLVAVPGATIHMTGSAFENESTNPAGLIGLRDLAMVFEGGIEGIDPFEVAGSDIGALAAGFESNFALGALQLGSDAAIGMVMLTDGFDNWPGWEGSEALYVESLILGAGSYLDLNGLNLYYLNFTNLGGTIDWNGGNLVQVPEPAMLVLLALSGLALLRRGQK